MPELFVVSTSAGLDTRDLVRALERRAPVGVHLSASAGLLAPSGDGLAREAARERGAVVVVVAPGGPDLLNHALLTIEGARNAGMAVAAVVIAGPGGAEQRERLRASAQAAVVELPDLSTPSSAVEGWPLEDWSLAEPVVAGGGGVALSPYAAWESRPMPDPRGAGRAVIDPVLMEIIETEGPILAGRAYRLFVKASGGKALTSIAKAPLTSSAYRLRQYGHVEFSTADENPGQDDDVLRASGSPPVRVRELGPRTLDEVPLSEINQLMERLRANGVGEADLARATLDSYGLVRMTSKAEAYLEQARTFGG